LSGDPVTDQNVIGEIKEGGPGMPAFQTTLSDSDIADLGRIFAKENVALKEKIRRRILCISPSQ